MSADFPSLRDFLRDVLAAAAKAALDALGHKPPRVLITATSRGSAVSDCGSTSPLTTRYEFAPDDPFVVRLTFAVDGRTDRPTRKVDRDMLCDACEHGETQTGDGDVLLRREGRALFLSLHSPDGDAKVVLPAREVAAFLRATYAAVPSGDERYDVDALVAAALGGAS